MGGKGSGPTTIYTEEIANQIVDEMSDGVPLATICKRPGMPRVSTVYDWLKMPERADFAGRLVRARKEGMLALEAQILEISDDADRDYVSRSKDGETREEFRPENVARAKLRIETRLKLLAIWDPKRYGPSILNKHADADGNNLPPPPRNVQIVVVKPGGNALPAPRNITPGKDET